MTRLMEDEPSLEQGIMGVMSFLESVADGTLGNGKNIGRDEWDSITVDTCWASDANYFETGVLDPRYDNSFIIVEEYADNEEAALRGHEAWVRKLKASPPPVELTNIAVWGMDSWSYKRIEGMP